MGDFFTTSFWMWIPLLTIVPLIPAMCYYDWKERIVPDWIIDAIYIVNTPVLVFMYLMGAYGIEEIIVTMLPVVIFYTIMRLREDFFHGDDFLIAAAICFFCVVNPFNPDAGAVGVKMMIYLIGTSMLFLGLMVVYNLVKERPPINNVGDIVSLILKTPEEGFPFIFPIAAAFILALIL
jgi:Flp pilus assembly protein protease CpaA